MAKENSYFVKINDPKNSRRVALESTRDILKILQSNEDFKKIKHKKMLLLNHFRKSADDIRTLIDNLKKMLPKAKIETKKSFAAETMKRPHTEVNKLEQELAAIEEKLSSL
ncbi:TPA: hypothetical protein HA219_00880 [Candidatus Woesearchaeota archaeon]|nr:hypothetical protein [Candidatus Woesearchaeota archaeon]HIH39266.1 hypothetical protein [Candidatus Woesearchaeota archaeon]